MDQLNRDLNYRINLSTGFSHPFILIVSKSTDKDKDGTGKQDDEKTSNA